MYRDIKYLYASILVRLVLLHWSCVETCRILCFVGFIAYLVLRRASKILSATSQRMKKFEDFHHYYIALALLHKRLENTVHILVYTLFNASFWILVAACWVCVKGTIARLTLPFYLTFVMLAVVMVMIYSFIIPMICNFCEIALKTVNCHILRTKFRYCYTKLSKRKFELLQACAVRPIQLKYGIFWILNKDFAKDYFWQVVQRTFDAILIIDF